ncbi:hypothetical protein, partial [Candidatus Thiosymbion oneisti]
MLFESYDRQNFGFLLIMWLLGFVALFGFEIRSLVYVQQDYVMPLLLVIGFIGSTFLLREVLIDRALKAQTVRINGKAVPVTLQPANEVLQDYVRKRASVLSIQTNINILSLPRTWNIVDAFVIGSGTRQSLVVTGGVQLLAVQQGSEHQERLRFLIDHELG